MPQIKVFLSYHSADKVLAGNIKRQLKQFGLDVFLAHDDIEPTQNWVDRILSELDMTKVLVPLLTEEFSTSKWTDQECGIALARGALIIALKVDVDPYGFLSTHQALKFRRDNVALSCLNLAKIIHKNAKFRKKFLDGLISSFSASDSFEEAKWRSSILIQFDGYNGRQVNEIVRAAIANDQIYLSFGAKNHLNTFLHQYREKADESSVKSLRQKMT